MFNRIFNPNNSLFQGISKVLDVMVLSILWVLLCIPLITLGPATTALYYSTVKCLRRGERAPYANFFHCFRTNFKIGAPAGLLLIVGAVLLLLEHNLLVRMAMGGSDGAVMLYYAFCLLAVVLVGMACYVFPVLSRFTYNLWGLLALSGQLALRHLPTTLLLGLLHLAAAWVYINFWIFLLPLICLPVLTALISSLLLERIFRKYTPMDEEMASWDREDRPWYLR